MAYFANGTEGTYYQEQYCQHCIHFDDCAIWTAHLLYNGKCDTLNILIPRDGIENLKCTMFVEAEEKPKQWTHQDELAALERWKNGEKTPINGPKFGGFWKEIK